MDTLDSRAGDNGFKLIMKYRNVIMGIAAIWIFVFHTWIPLYHEPTNEITLFFHSIEEYVRKMGYCGVDIFLLMSGMGLTYSIKKGSVANFYKRRLRRVFLPYLAITLIRWPIDNWTLWMFLENATGFSFYTKNIHSFCWFVPAIATLYLVFPLYYRFFCKAKSKLLFTSLSIILWFLLSFVASGYLRGDLYEFTNRIPIFLIGIYFGELSQKHTGIRLTKIHYLLFLATFASGLFLAYMYNFCDFELILPYGKEVIPNILISVSLAFYVAKLLDILNRRLPKPGRVLNEALSFWGKMSLEMYCAYICFLIPYFLICVRLLADLELPVLAINLVIFSLTSSISLLVSLVLCYFRRFLELPKRSKLADNSKHVQQGSN